jgi:hypothetical protein
MDTLPIWAWWIIAAVLVLLSPVFAFLAALLVAILIGAVKEGSAPAFTTLIAAGLAGGLLLRRRRTHPSPNDIARDQA